MMVARDGIEPPTPSFSGLGEPVTDRNQKARVATFGAERTRGNGYRTLIDPSYFSAPERQSLILTLDGSNAMRWYPSKVIKTFRDAETERLWKEERSRRILAKVHKAALKKLQMLNAARSLGD